MAVPNWEYVERRALALLEFVDALGRPVVTPVSVSAPALPLMQKRLGQIVVLETPGLGAGTVPLDVRPVDPTLGARRFGLALPRDPNPANAATPGSLFRAVEIALLPTPAATVTGLAAALRVTVTRSDDGRRIEGALVRLRPAGGLPQARALTDAAGDALVLVGGVPLSSPGTGGATLPDIAATLDAVVDPALVRFHADDRLVEARADAEARRTGFIDPDDVEGRLGGAATTAQTVRIGVGRTRTAAIAWTPP